MNDRSYYNESDRLDHWHEHGEHLPDDVVEHIELDQLGTFLGMPVFTIDGEFLRGHVDVDFTTGGNAGRYKYVPEWHLWVELRDVTDTAPTIVHEGVECTFMRYLGLSYSDAHDCANMFEWPFRRMLAEGKFDGPLDNSLGAAKYFMGLPQVRVLFRHLMETKGTRTKQANDAHGRSIALVNYLHHKGGGLYLSQSVFLTSLGTIG